jgi:hypothetical protein
VWPVVGIAVTAAVGGCSARASSSSAPPSATVSAPPSIALSRVPSTTRSVASPSIERPTEHQGRLGEADGVVAGEVTVFDDVPAVTHLDRALLKALRRAATDATDDGVELDVDSGWRSADYQEHLLDEAVSKYGSRKQAARWVATAATSLHVKGQAVDIGPAQAQTWLSQHGAGYGICRIYRNEPWHFELRSTAVSRGCPRLYADPAHDPRLQP